MCLFREAIIHSAETCDGGYSTLRNCKENKNVPVVHARTFLSRGEESFLQANTFREGEQRKAAKNQKDESDGAKSEKKECCQPAEPKKKSKNF